MSDVVLCVRRGSGELSAVAAALRARGVEPIVMDASAFPTAVPLTLAYDRGGARSIPLAGMFRGQLTRMAIHRRAWRTAGTTLQEANAPGATRSQPVDCLRI